MGCVAAQRANPYIKAFCDQLRARGKRTKVALVAAMRKLLAQLNAMMRDGEDWDPAESLIPSNSALDSQYSCFLCGGKESECPRTGAQGALIRH
ncbi:transposase [Caballeronia arvi]|uniref:Transposase n=2 Tax=Caballeronia arvi TaxID=1777135 RepID=A0A158KZ61_9BURK|nr:transposase [Caballeronia arvi]